MVLDENPHQIGTSGDACRVTVIVRGAGFSCALYRCGMRTNKPPSRYPSAKDGNHPRNHPMMFRANERVRAMIEAAAARGNRTVSELINLIVLEWCERHDF